MAPMYIVVREIKRNKTTAAIKLRAVRTYDVPQSRFNQDIKSRECVLHDEEHVEKVMPYLRKDFAEPVIVLIQMGRVKVSENSAEVKITSSDDATQLLFNGDSSDFVDFRQSKHLERALPQTQLIVMVIQPIVMVMIKIPKELKTMLGRVKHFPEMFNTYCPGLLADKDDGLSQVTDYETDSDEISNLYDIQALQVLLHVFVFKGFFSEEEAESPNVNAVKEQSVDVTESDAVKRSLLDQFSSTQNSKKKRVMVVKEEGDDDKET
nr:uncharacterized protein LOC109162457 [Ipomoea trifida]